MDLEQIKKEAEQIKELDFNKLPPEKVDELIEKLLGMLDTTEQHLSQIKIDDHE
jgi:DNA-directed RNA polymerase subunit F